MGEERRLKRCHDPDDPERELTDEQVRQRAWAGVALYLFAGAVIAIALIVD